MKSSFFLVITTLPLAAGVGMANTDEYGCKVPLCLSNPAGPMAEAECKPPIERMLREQRQRNPPACPTCEEANGAAYVQLGSSAYDPCPGGTAALPAGATALWGRRGSEGTPQPVDAGALVFTGIGEGDTISGATSFSKKRVCVGRNLRKVNLVSGVGDASSSIEVDVYDFIATLDPIQGTMSYVDVIVNGKRYRRVRF